MMTRIALIAAAAVSASFMTAVPVTAAEAPVQVFFGDLNTSSPAGATTLAARMKKGLDRACERPDVRNLRAGVECKECREAALEWMNAQLARQGVVPTVTIG